MYIYLYVITIMTKYLLNVDKTEYLHENNVMKSIPYIHIAWDISSQFQSNGVTLSLGLNCADKRIII